MIEYFGDLEQDVTRLGMKTVFYASVILIVTTALALLLKDKSKLKLPLFLVMAITLLGSTFVLFGGTIYLNTHSESKGPVHWHTDIEFWACGAELELRNPNGLLTNKIGTATYHEHNDKRIHLEGVVVRKAEDASLEKFMRVTHGFITPDAIGIPLNEDPDEWFASGDKLDGDEQSSSFTNELAGRVKQTADGPIMELVNGQTCGSESAELQVFLYRYDKATKTYAQQKLKDGYIMRDESVVPPGDCVIVEFDTPKERTDKLCQQYGVRDSQRCVEFGVEEYNPELCNITETTGGSE